jgi:hypothetical protein
LGVSKQTTSQRSGSSDDLKSLTHEIISAVNAVDNPHPPLPHPLLIQTVNIYMFSFSLSHFVGL